jgi:ABC-type microcin C transport system duplicated ATPase subunit YejF
MASGFVALHVTPEAREQLRKLSYALTGGSDRRVTLADALLAACAVAANHPDEALAALPVTTAPGNDGPR